MKITRRGFFAAAIVAPLVPVCGPGTELPLDPRVHTVGNIHVIAEYSFSPEEMEWLETRTFAAHEICHAFSVPRESLSEIRRVPLSMLELP